MELELALLRGMETLQDCVNPLDGKLQFLRFLAGSPERLAWCIRQAAESQSFFRSNCTKQWLLTVLTSQDIAPKSNITIQSNVVPSRAYLTKLAGVRATCRGHQCKGGFVLTSDIGPALEGQLPHQSCTNCALAEKLRIRLQLEGRRAVDELANLLNFWFLDAKDVEPVRYINGGNEGDVYTILWQNGTFARKRFHCGDDLLNNPKFQHPKINRELEVALRVSHPNIVHCFGCSTDCDLFMEVLDEDLESFLTRAEEMDPPFSLRDSLEILLQVAEAVKHLHENGFIHGDLKPGNILLSKLVMPHPDVPFYLVKVADFGCAQRFHSSGAVTRENFDVKIGSSIYRAPELKRCNNLGDEDLQEAVQNIDPPKVDVFSFGVLAKEVVSNVDEGTISDGNRLTSLNSFLLRCEAPEPGDRPSFGEICVTLNKFSDSGPCEKGGMWRDITKHTKRMWHDKSNRPKKKKTNFDHMTSVNEESSGDSSTN